MKMKIRKKWEALCSCMLMFCMLSLLASCDKHEAVDRGIHVGYVLCSDHSCMSLDAYGKQEGMVAVGVVFAEQTDEHPALAVALTQYEDCFCDSLGMVNGTSGSTTAYDGFSNTVSMYNSYVVNEETKVGHGCPIAMRTYDAGYYGQSLYIPSVAEMRLLCKGAPIVNRTLAALGGTPITLDGKCWYWTSTEVSDNAGSQAWLCSALNGGVQETPKTESHLARPILQLNYPE